MKQLLLHISNIIKQPNDVVTFEFCSTENIPYVPGQFLSLELDINGRKVRRSYSLQSSPFINEPLAISVKRIENGEVSRWLHDKFQIGDQITAYEPNGLFTYEPKSQLQRTIFLIAAGTGITPLFSILKSALLKELLSKITLIYSNHSAESTLFKNALDLLQKHYPNQLNIVYLWSNSKNLLLARLNRDVLEKLVAQYLVHKKEDALFYTCGPTDYMLMCRIVLLGLGYNQEQIKKETFVLPEDENDEDDETHQNEHYQDKHTYAVNLNFNGVSYLLEIPFNRTILDIALAHHIELPYSCKSGMCGSCAANCIGGNVRLQYNEVLTDKEISAGRILLCTAHPLENDIQITL